MANGVFKNKHQGSLLLIAIVTMGVLSMLYLGISESYRTSTLFFQRTKEYYQIQIMKELFLKEFLNTSEDERLINGKVNYNVGQVIFVYQAPYLDFTIRSLHYQLNFNQNLSSEIAESSAINSESTEKVVEEQSNEEEQIEEETDTE